MNRPLRIGIVCYPTLGGSGVVATELAVALADRGNQVHMFTYAPPHRETHGVRLHLVDVVAYPLLKYPPYDLALASSIVDACSRGNCIDILHVHYAVPHAISAYLASQMLGGNSFSTITTLHGTDISIVGSDPAYASITRFGIEQSDAVTAVSANLRQNTFDVLSVNCEIEVIPNFVNSDVFRPVARGKRTVKRLSHASNFRAVKRPLDVIRIFSLVRNSVDARLSLIGDGPELQSCLSLASDLGVLDFIDILGPIVVPNDALAESDLFLLPSEQESFGLSALEALSCGVPVISTRIGGVPEVVIDGEVGILFDVGDVRGMANAAVELLNDTEKHARMSKNAVELARNRFSREKIVSLYEDFYHKTLSVK
ncbi:MAG: N-acetyl-alpha-D-glucosaminyl L-malate synthase BshA [Planctomycetota bacterium]